MRAGKTGVALGSGGMWRHPGGFLAAEIVPALYLWGSLVRAPGAGNGGLPLRPVGQLHVKGGLPRAQVQAALCHLLLRAYLL